MRKPLYVIEVYDYNEWLPTSIYSRDQKQTEKLLKSPAVTGMAYEKVRIWKYIPEKRRAKDIWKVGG
jgi:hypothetical protein